MTSFPNLLGHYTKDLLWFHPTQRLTKLTHTEMARNKEDEKGLPISIGSKSKGKFPVNCSTASPSNFLHERNQWPAQLSRTTYKFHHFSSHVFKFPDTSCLSPSPLLPALFLPEPRIQPRPLQLHECKMLVDSHN